MMSQKIRTYLFWMLLVLSFLPAQAGALDEIELHGFVDSRAGMRTTSDPTQRQTTLLEGRLQLESSHQGEAVSWQVRSDFVADGVADDENLDLQEGSGPIDLREANLLFSPLDWVDVKAGRQILTWGTGDLLFINDLFPKDWQSFFIGRDLAYLKAPSDALLVSLFPSWGTIDLVYTPRFDPDRYISGERLSYYSPVAGRSVGHQDQLRVDKRKELFSEDELALRISRNLAGFEAALYGYHGYWKSPVGYDPASGRNTFPPLNVVGASLRGSFVGGIANMEIGQYDSRDDSDGDDPFVPNSQARVLLGYERELARDLTGGVQYYLEHMNDYSAYRRTLPAGAPAQDQDRQLLTLRLTSLLLNQNLTLSLFAYLSPSDQDFYLRPTFSYKLTDSWQLSGGGNLFGGSEESTFFGQFEDNSNAYAAVRYSF